MHTANKGEWSEFYAFLKILAERKVGLADENLDAVANSEVTFVKLFRSSNDGSEYVFDLSGNDLLILDVKTGAEVKSLQTSVIASILENIFDKITNGKNAFAIAEAETMSELLSGAVIKAPNTDKADIVGSIIDRNTAMEERAGFSVKSFVGGTSTLLNASKATNFVFKVTGLTITQISEVNEIGGSSKIRDRVTKIGSLGGQIVFSRVNSKVFEKNLRKIDTMMPEFLANMLFNFYGGKGRSLRELTALLAANETLTSKYGLSVDDYSFKLKQLLVSVALGLVPNSAWDGLMRAHGGYLIVKGIGALVCYQAFHRDLFLDYLFNNTKFETASSTRHGFGVVYDQGGELFFDLNLQIRFS